MCIRDSGEGRELHEETAATRQRGPRKIRALVAGWAARRLKRVHAADLLCSCLLYTSDAADERSSVDLGGRRIIKKKKSSTRHNEASTGRNIDYVDKKRERK